MLQLRFTRQLLEQAKDRPALLQANSTEGVGGRRRRQKPSCKMLITASDRIGFHSTGLLDAFGMVAVGILERACVFSRLVKKNGNKAGNGHGTLAAKPCGRADGSTCKRKLSQNRYVVHCVAILQQQGCYSKQYTYYDTTARKQSEGSSATVDEDTNSEALRKRGMLDVEASSSGSSAAPISYSTKTLRQTYRSRSKSSPRKKKQSTQKVSSRGKRPRKNQY